MIRASFVTFFIVGLSGCYRPDSSDRALDPDADRAPSDLFQPDDDVAPPPCLDEEKSDLSALRLSVRTSAVGGQFKPRNVGAVWIEDSEGTFIKTLERWGTTRAKWLLRFNEASDDNVVDAITGATKKVHETHELVWDLSDFEGCEVPAGSYRVALEITDRSGQGVAHDIPFEKDSGFAPTMPADHPQFHDMLLELE